MEGCEATPIDQLFSGRKKRSAPNRDTEPVTVEWRDTSNGEELLEQFIRDVTGNEKQVYNWRAGAS